MLKKAKAGTSVPDFWLATEKYDQAPQRKSNNEVNTGTKAPISEDFKSPFVRQKIEDVAEWLQGKPDSVDLDAHHFAVLDKQTAEDGQVLVCKIGDKDLKGDKIQTRKYDAKMASTFLVGLEYGDWEG